MAIPFAHLIRGSLSWINNAETFVNTSFKLYEEKNYQVSIPLATFAIEEILKGYFLLRHSRNNPVLELDEWNKLNDHKYKLSQLFKNVFEAIQKVDENEFENHREKLYPLSNNTSFEQVKRALTKNIGNFPSFQKLREACLYSDWNEATQSWNNYYPNAGYIALTYYVLQTATILLVNLKMAFEREINKFRKSGNSIPPTGFVTYNEYKEPKDYESLKLAKLQQSKLNSQMYVKGANLFSKFVSGTPIQLLIFEYFKNFFSDYLKIVNSASKWENAHPLLKSLLIYLEKKEGEKGNFMAISINKTKSNKEIANPFVVMPDPHDESKIKFVDLRTKKTFDYDDNFIEKIMKTELILDRKEGLEVELSVLIESLSSIGLKSKIIKRKELSEIIKNGKKHLRNGVFVKIDVHTKNEMNSLLDIAGWYSCSNLTRTLMIQSFGYTKYPGYQIYILEAETILKEHCRWLILRNLYGDFLPTI